MKIFKFVNFFIQLFPAFALRASPKVAKSASAKTILNSTNYVINV